jgi:RNA polymerase sigma-70 factor (ECF subfamily)
MHTGQLSDEVLAARVARGDRTAFDILYDRHASTVLGLALRISGERTSAEDILQETFWRVWRNGASYQPERGPFAGWLFRIARNLAIDAYRRRSLRPQAIPVEMADADPILDRVPNPDINIPEQAQLNVMAGQVRDAMKSLPRKQRQVIELAYFYGMTRLEIAEVTGEPLGTIHTRARLGLQKLREALKRAGFEF